MLYISISISSMLYIVRLHYHIPNEYLTTVTDKVIVPIYMCYMFMHYGTHMNKVQQHDIEDIRYVCLIYKKGISFGFSYQYFEVFNHPL